MPSRPAHLRNKPASRRGSPAVRRRLLKGIGLVTATVAGLFLLLLAGVYWGWFGLLPGREELSAIRHHEATEVWSTDGELIGKYYLENRVLVDMAHISPWVPKALVATEDARFFTHRGIDLTGTARVIVRTLLFGDRRQGGGSTISQQLAKNLFPREKGGMLLGQKLREMIIATRLEKAYDKEGLLHLYLNTVPFGDNIYGIEVAARRYFGVSASRLQLHEAALLVGMLKANTAYHPVRHPDRALQRRNTVLARMASQGVINAEVHERAQSLPLGLRYSRESHDAGLATYFREHLRLEAGTILDTLRKPGGERYGLYTDGLRIYTTIHAGMQRLAEEGMSRHMVALQSAFDKEWGKDKPWEEDALLRRAMQQSPRWKEAEEAGLDEAEIRKQFGEPVDMQVFTWQGPVNRKWTPMDSIRHALSLLHAGILAGDPSSGAVRVWVGGISQQFFPYDQVKARRQAGSVFKPVVYAAALEAGFDPCDYFEDLEVTYGEYQDWTPRNAAQTNGGVYTLAGALAHSLNTVTAALIMEMGVEPVIDLARKMGIRGRLPDQPSLALGTAEMDLFDALRLYGTLANEGLTPEWYYIERIETSAGEVLYARSVEAQKATFKRSLAPEHALVLRHALEMAVDSGTAMALRTTYGLRGGLAGKTGTTQDHADGWFAGFSPHLVAVARVGAALPVIHFRTLRSGSGARTALPLFARLWSGCQANPALRPLVAPPFAPLPEHVWAEVNCPPYLEEYPELAGEPGGLLDFLGLGADRESREDPGYQPSELGEKMRKEREKRKKKEARREAWRSFWDGVLGRD